MFDRMSEVFITSPRRASNKKRDKRRLEIEGLEARQVMAANLTGNLNTDDGVLRIEGTPNADQIYINNEAGRVSVSGINLTVGNRYYSSQASSVAANTVTRIEVSALAGNDVVWTRENLTNGSVAIPMTIYGGPGGDNLYGGSARDTIMGGDKLDSEQTGQAAARLDQANRFYAAGSEWQNYLGLNEKWFLGQSGPWYYIKPNGDIYKSNASGTSVGTYFAKVDAGFHSNLSKLLDADSGPAAAGIDRLKGLYATGNYYQNYWGKNEKWVMSQTENAWYYITPDGTLFSSATGAIAASLDASYWADPNKLVTASTVFADNDSIYGYGGKDDLLGGADADFISGGVEIDFLGGGLGNDTLLGDGGDDYLRGDDGNDTLQGGTEKDTLVGEDGNDTLRGEVGDDTLWGGSERNTMNYVNDTDWLYGDIGNDELHGGAGAYDYLYGGDNDDVLWGEDGIDYLYGGNHNDALYGGAAADYLYGEAGNDGLFGGYNDTLDTMTGGTGAHRFLRPAWEQNFTIYKGDTVADLAAEDAELMFTYGDKSWTDAEIILADKGLGWLHKTTNNTTLLKLPNGWSQYLYRVSYLGQDIGGDNDGKGTMRITDLGVTSALDTVIVHEIAHNWDSPSVVPGFASLSGWRYHNLSDDPIPHGYKQGLAEGKWEAGGKYHVWIYQASAPFARDYGRTNPDEDFATCLEEYYAVSKATGNPATNWQAKYNFVNNWLSSKRT